MSRGLLLAILTPALALLMVGCSKDKLPLRPGLVCGAPDEAFVKLDAAGVVGVQLQKYAVTAHDFECCAVAGGCELQTFFDHRHRGCTIGDDGRADHPANCVNWQGAAQYCEWREARLPTPAEWLAAAGGPARRYPWGDGPVAGMANCDQGVCADKWPVTAPVTAFAHGTSPSGAVQLAGNVFSWLDAWHVSPPATPSKLAAPTSTYRLLKGGSWREHEHAMRNTSLHYKRPTERLSNIGFRCAR